MWKEQSTIKTAAEKLLYLFVTFPFYLKYTFCILPVMPRSKSLSEFEKGQTIAFHGEGKTSANVARRLYRSANVVSRYLKNPQKYNAKKRSKRPLKLSNHNKRRIKQEITTGGSSWSQVKREIELEVSKTTIWREITNHGTFQCRKRSCASLMTLAHNISRVWWAMECSLEKPVAQCYPFWRENF